MKLSHLAVLALALTSISSQAMAWGADGHRTVAAIALKPLPPDKAQAADNLLNNSDVGRGFIDAAAMPMRSSASAIIGACSVHGIL